MDNPPAAPITGHDFFWASHGCKHEDPDHNGPHECDCGEAYQRPAHCYGHDADMERFNAALAKHGCGWKSESCCALCVKRHDEPATAGDCDCWCHDFDEQDGNDWG